MKIKVLKNGDVVLSPEGREKNFEKAANDFRSAIFYLKIYPNKQQAVQNSAGMITSATEKYWNQVNLTGQLSDDDIKALIRHSYHEVVKKLKKQERTDHPEITEVM